MRSVVCAAFVSTLLACSGSSDKGQPSGSSASAMASGASSGRKHAPGGASGSAAASAAAPPPAFTLSPAALPGVTAPTFIDYFAVEPGTARLWVPVAATGSVLVYDSTAGSFSHVDGLGTAELVVDGKKRAAGPNAIALGDGVAYVGNRATNEICAIDDKTLKMGTCLKLTAQTDAVSYVASAKELWVTTPRDSSIAVLDATVPGTLKPKTVINLGGQPEGYVVDTKRNLFYTNLEDKGSTLAIDIKTHRVVSTWNPDCGENGPRGLALDVSKSFVFVSCTDHVQALDGDHQGAYLGKIETGAGVDKIDYREDKGLLYAASGKTGKLLVLHVDDKGLFSVVASVPTAAGARSVVLAPNGAAYIADTTGARLLVAPPMP